MTTRVLLGIALLCLARSGGALHAESLPIPNGSFESPEIEFAGPQMESWQKAPQPAWYTDPLFPWEQLAGLFANTTNGSFDHIDNLDGRQAAFLFAVPGAAIFQEAAPAGGVGSPTAPRFTAQFEVGKSYILTAGVLGGGGGMSNGTTLELSFYYRDAASNKVTVAATTITNSQSLFPTRTRLTEFQVDLPKVRATDAWAGKHIGIQLASTVSFDRMGGYWDVDDVRLRTVEDPALRSAAISAGQFEFMLHSAPGRYEVLASPDIALPLAQWSSLGMVTNFTGSVQVRDPGANLGRRFYKARSSP